MDTPRRNLWPWLIVSMLAMVIIANAIMIVVSSSTPPLLEADDAYEAALKHDAVLAERAAAAALGWTSVVEQRADGLWWTVKAAGGAPVEGLRGEVALNRADTTAHDAKLAFVEVTPGQYRADWRGAPGEYRARVALSRGEERWVATRRMQLR